MPRSVVAMNLGLLVMMGVAAGGEVGASKGTACADSEGAGSDWGSWGLGGVWWVWCLGWFWVGSGSRRV